MSNPVVQWQILAKDPESVALFYRKLFGWTISANNALGYREIAAEQGGIPGGIWPAPPEAPNFVQLFVSVEDVAAAVAKALDLGAKTIVPPSVLPDGDTMAVILDPSGMSIGLVRRARGGK